MRCQQCGDDADERICDECQDELADLVDDLDDGETLDPDDLEDW